MTSPRQLAIDALATLERDLDELTRIDEYQRGIQDEPYMPDNADAEYKLLASRAITNVMDFIIATPAQAMYVDGFRSGHTVGTPLKTTPEAAQAVTPEWEHWQRSRLDARQAAIYHGAIKFGHAFTITEKDAKHQVVTKGLSAMRTVALFEDPANDDSPEVALHVTKMPRTGTATKEARKGEARMWDDHDEYLVKFESFADEDSVTVELVGPHGAEECPVTRFAIAVDLEGRTTGVVAPMIPLQNRINQTIFDLLVVQSFASFKVRTVTGMAPPLKMKPVYEDGEIVDWEPERDANGKPIAENINLSARRMFWAEDENVKFSQLDETPLDGFIASIGMAFQHIAALSQTPPHHLLGQIANLSAEALTAAESALTRKVEEFKSAFGESWERVFRIAAQVGDYEGAEDFTGEVLWRDVEQRSLAQAGDALSKLHTELGIPARGLWRRVPGVTANELALWDDLAVEEDAQASLANAITRAGSADRPTIDHTPGGTGGNPKPPSGLQQQPL